MKTGLTDDDFSMGRAEAWDPSERENLKRNFLPIRQYSSISDADNIFLCGRRGSGKSAIALRLSEEGRQAYKEAIAGEKDNYGSYLDIVQRLATDIVNRGLDLEIQRVTRWLWVWVLRVQVMKTLISQFQTVDDEGVVAIKRYFSTLPEPLSEGSTIGELLYNAFSNAYMLLEKSEVEFTRHLINLTASKEFRSAMEAFHRKSAKGKVLLVLDTLESYKIFRPYMIDAFRGILDAVIAIGADKLMEHVSLKLFLPSEVYDLVFSPYPGKVGSRAVFMRWRAADLVSVLARRYLNILTRTEALPARELARYEEDVGRAFENRDGRRLRRTFWYDSGLLPTRVTNRVGIQEDCFAYMLRHTQRRPRELIMLVQRMVDRARQKDDFPIISEQTVIESIHNREFLDLVVREALAPYEGRLPVELSHPAHNIFHNRPIIMKGRDLRHFADEIYSMAPPEGIDPGEFLRTLCNSGVIGLLEEPADVAKGRPYWKARFEYLMQGNVPINDRETYCVHPAMADLFRMRSPEYGAVYPYPEAAVDGWLEEEAGI